MIERRRVKHWLAAPFLAALAFQSSCHNPVERQIRAYNNNQLARALSDYETAHLQGHLLDACTKAAQIAAAYRETGSPNYIAWNAKRQQDCKAALDNMSPGGSNIPESPSAALSAPTRANPRSSSAR